MARDPEFLRAGFGLEAPDAVAGFVHLGSPATQPPDRPRPNLDAITTWVDT
jgi:nitroreductase